MNNSQINESFLWASILDNDGCVTYRFNWKKIGEIAAALAIAALFLSILFL